MADQEKKEREQAQTPAGQEKVSTENGWDPYGNGWPDASVNQYGYDQGYWQPPGASPQPTPYGGWTASYSFPCSEAHIASSPGFMNGADISQYYPPYYPRYPYYPHYYSPHHYYPYHYYPYHPYHPYHPHYPHRPPYPGHRRSRDE